MTSCRASSPVPSLTAWCLGLMCVLMTVADSWAQQRPLQTQDPGIIPPGNLSLEVGFDFLQNAKYPQSGLQGDLTSLGVIGINVGLGEIVEFQIQGTAQNFLSISQMTAAPITPILNSSGTATQDFGDLMFSTKILMVPEGRRLPSVAFRPSVQLPNASSAKGLGLNSTQFYGTFIFGKHFGQLNTFANLGLGILSNPIEAGIQNDVLVYGLAGIYPVTKSMNVAGEVFGRWSTRTSGAPLGTESLSQLRLGLQINGAGFRWDVAGVAGLTKTSPRSGITFGVTKEFPAFQIPTTNKTK
jgi:outer membrane putative beta-barrel porin/alpha-amylase